MSCPNDTLAVKNAIPARAGVGLRFPPHRLVVEEKPRVAWLEVGHLARMSETKAEGIVLVPHPSLRLFTVKMPADTIWRAVIEQDNEALADISLAPESLYIMVRRDIDDVISETRTSAAVWHFARALQSGTSLQITLDQIVHDQSEMDVGKVLGGLLFDGCFVDFLTDDVDDDHLPRI